MVKDPWSAWLAPQGGQVGGSVLEDAAHARDGLGRDIPITAEALELQDSLLKLADSLGIGEEFRAIYFNVQGGLLIGGGAGVALGVGFAAGALGGALVGIVVGILSIFTDDDDENEKAYKRAIRVREKFDKLYARQDLKGLAAEQAAIAKNAAFEIPGYVKSKPELVTQATKFASFYTKADTILSATEKAVFVSASNIARWRSALTEIDGLPPWRIFYLKGIVGPDFATRLEVSISAEQKTLATATTKMGSGPKGSAIVPFLTLAAAGSLAIWRPDVALRLARTAGSTLSTTVNRFRK